MKKKTLSTLLLIGIIASMSVSMTGCGKKESVKPVQSESEIHKQETENGISVTTTDGKIITTTKTDENGNVTYEFEEDKSGIKEELPMEEDGYKKTTDAQLNLSYIGDAVKNDSFKSKLNGFGITDEKITMHLETDIDLNSGYYIINSTDGKQLGQDKIGLTINKDANGNQIVEFDRTIFENLPEDSKLESGWSNNPIIFFLSDNNDNIIVVDAFMSL